MSSDPEISLPAVPEMPRESASRVSPAFVLALIAVFVAGSAAAGIFELTRQTFSAAQAWNVVLSGIGAGLIAVLGSIMWFDYSSRGPRNPDDDPGFNVQLAQALTGIAQLLDDKRSSPATRAAALKALLSLGRASPTAAGMCADVVASVIRSAAQPAGLPPEHSQDGSSGAALELAIQTWSQLARRGFDAPRRLDLSGMPLAGLRLQNLKLAGANLAGADLRHSDISGSDLAGADLSGADLSHAVAIAVRFQRATLTKANLTRSRLHDSDFTGALLAGARLDAADLRRARLARALLPDAHLPGADLSEADLRGALLAGADVANAIFTSARLAAVAVSPGTERYLPEAAGPSGSVQVLSNPADLEAWASASQPGGEPDE